MYAVDTIPGAKMQAKVCLSTNDNPNNNNAYDNAVKYMVDGPVLSRWFCCCLVFVYCCSHCLWGFVLLVTCFVMQYFVSFLVLLSSHWGRESWLRYIYCLLYVM